MAFADGSKYTGSWFREDRDGEGNKIIFNNEGTMEWPNGFKFKGMWRRNVPEGDAKYNWFIVRHKCIDPSVKECFDEGACSILVANSEMRLPQILYDCSCDQFLCQLCADNCHQCDGAKRRIWSDYQSCECKNDGCKKGKKRQKISWWFKRTLLIESSMKRLQYYFQIILYYNMPLYQRGTFVLFYFSSLPWWLSDWLPLDVFFVCLISFRLCIVSLCLHVPSKRHHKQWHYHH